MCSVYTWAFRDDVSDTCDMSYDFGILGEVDCISLYRIERFRFFDSVGCGLSYEELACGANG